MRGLKLVTVLASILALIAIAGATASAALPEFLPGATGTAFTGKSEKITWQVKGGAALTCTSSTTKGELTSKTAATILLTVTGCTTTGLAEESLGDPSGTILMQLTVSNCFIATSPLVGALLFKITTPVHVEIVATGLLFVVEGSFVASMSPLKESTKEYKLTIEQKEGKQADEGCLNAAGTEKLKETLTTSIDSTGATQTGEEAKGGVLTFTSVAQEFMD